jgi:hypothetical protein
MPRPKALNEQPAMTRWTTEPKSKSDSDALTDDEYRKRYGNEPRPTENEHGNYADEEKCEPATRPNYEPRLSVKAPGDRLLDGVH